MASPRGHGLHGPPLGFISRVEIALAATHVRMPAELEFCGAIRRRKPELSFEEMPEAMEGAFPLVREVWDARGIAVLMKVPVLMLDREIEQQGPWEAIPDVFR